MCVYLWFQNAEDMKEMEHVECTGGTVNNIFKHVYYHQAQNTLL